MQEVIRSWYTAGTDVASLQNEHMGFFNNDYAGHTAVTAGRFTELAGLTIKRPEPPQQLDFLGDL